MSLVRIGFAKIFVIERLYNGAVVRATQGFVCVVIVKSLCAHCFQVHIVAHLVVEIGLTAAVYATSGARHNFNRSEERRVGKECL